MKAFFALIAILSAPLIKALPTNSKFNSFSAYSYVSKELTTIDSIKMSSPEANAISFKFCPENRDAFKECIGAYEFAFALHSEGSDGSEVEVGNEGGCSFLESAENAEDNESLEALKTTFDFCPLVEGEDCNCS